MKSLQNFSSSIFYESRFLRTHLIAAQTKKVPGGTMQGSNEDVNAVAVLNSETDDSETDSDNFPSQKHVS